MWCVTVEEFDPNVTACIFKKTVTMVICIVTVCKRRCGLYGKKLVSAKNVDFVVLSYAEFLILKVCAITMLVL